jgi:autotransporter-associated beta strand protein
LNIGSERFAVAIGHASAGGTLNVNASNSFVGDTLINPGAALVINTGATNRPLGFGEVEVYGTLQAGGNRAGFAAASGNTNVYSINLHPGGTVVLDNTTTGPNTNRWADGQALNLHGGSLRLLGVRTNNVGVNELIGEVNVALGSFLIVDGESNGLTQITVTNLNRGGSGTLQVQRDIGFVGTSAFGSSNRLVALNAPVVSNGIAAPWIINATDHRHFTYVVGAGFTNATYSLNTLDGSTLGTEVVDQQAVITLSTDPNLHALRSSGAIFSTGVSDTITLNSGSLVVSGNSAINATVDFAGKEALIYVNGTFSNNVPFANAATVTKFGVGTLRISAQSPAYTNAWTVNRGTLTLPLGAGILPTGGTNFALGASVFGNAIELNGNDTTLNLSSAGTNITYSSGVIRTKNQAVLVNDPQVNNAPARQLFAPHGIEVSAENGGPLGALLRVDLARSRTVLESIGQVRLGADTTFNVRNTGSANNNTGGTNRIIFAGGLGGTNVTLAKTGNGVLEIPGDNSSTFVNGSVKVLGGTLSVGANGSLGNAATTVSVASNAVLELNAGVAGFSPVASVTQLGGSAERWLGPSGRFSNSAALETISIATNVDLQIANQATNANMASKTVRMHGGAFGGYQFIDDARAANITNGFNFELAANSKVGQSSVDIGRAGVTTRLNGVISESGGARSLTKVGLDTTIFGAQNSYSGGTRVHEGTLRLGIANALNPAGDLVVDEQAVFDLAGFNQTVQNFRGGGMLTNSIATNTIVFTTFNAFSNDFSGSIGGPMNFVKQGPGALRLNGVGSSVGARQIDSGTLVLGVNTVNNSGPLGANNSTVVINDPGAGAASGLIAAGSYSVPQEISIIGDIGGQKIVGSSGANSATFSGNLLLVGGITFTADAGGSATFTGTGSRNLTKTGAGTVALDGSGTISGSMVVSNGTLLVNSTSVGNPGASHSVEAATLGGSGTVIGTVFAGYDTSFNEYAARISPGNSAGALTINGDVFFSTMAKLTLELGGLIATNQHDRLNIGGTAFFDGSQLELALINSYFPATNSIFDLVQYGAYSGNAFANAADGARLNTTDNLGSFRVNYTSTNLFVDQFQFVDTDTDGIYDAWALRHFNLLSLANGTGPTQRYGDFDGDGQNNYAEFMAGTLPTNSASALAITTVQVSGTANLAFQWAQADELSFRTPGYQIQYTTNFTSWQTVTSPVLSQPSPGIWQWVDDGTQTGGTAPLNLPTMRSYRVQVK